MYISWFFNHTKFMEICKRQYLDVIKPCAIPLKPGARGGMPQRRLRPKRA